MKGADLAGLGGWGVAFPKGSGQWPGHVALPKGVPPVPAASVPFLGAGGDPTPNVRVQTVSFSSGGKTEAWHGGHTAEAPGSQDWAPGPQTLPLPSPILAPPHLSVLH